jgi:putative transposase
MKNPFRYFNSSPEIIRLTVMMYVRYALSLRQVEDLLFERGIDICHETVRLWWNRFGPMFAAEIRKRRVHHRSYSNWRWHLDEVFVRINGETHYLWRAVDHEGEVLEVFVTKRRDRKAALQFLRRAMKRYGQPRVIVTDRLRSYRAAMNVIGNAADQECGRWLNNRAENSHQPFRRREGRCRNSGTSRLCRSSPQFTLQSTITSTSTATSTAAKRSSRTAQQRWPSGASLRRENYIMRKFGDWFALD